MVRLDLVLQGRARDWTRLAGDLKGGRSRPGTAKGGEGRGVLDEPGAGEAIIGARVGIFWEDDETFYKASIASDSQCCTRSCFVTLLYAALCSPLLEAQCCIS